MSYGCSPCAGLVGGVPANQFQSKGNPLMDALSGDPRDLLPIVLASQGVGWIPLTAEMLGVSKIAWAAWAMANLWEGWQGILNPFVTSTLAAGTAVVNLATAQNGPALGWTVSVRFPPLNTVNTPLTVVDSRTDRAGNVFAFTYQIDAPMYQQDSVSVLQFAHGLVAGVNCLPFPMMDLSGTPQPVVAAPTATRAGTKTYNGQTSTVVVTGFLTETAPAVRQFQTAYSALQADWITSKQALAQVVEQNQRLQDAQMRALENYQRNGQMIAAQNLIPTAQQFDRSAPIMAAKNGIGSKAYSYPTNGNGNGKVLQAYPAPVPSPGHYFQTVPPQPTLDPNRYVQPNWASYYGYTGQPMPLRGY